MIFSPNSDGVILMRAVNADCYSGGLVQWLDADNDRLAPSGHTWDKSLAARLSFNVQITQSGLYDLQALVNTEGRNCWLWVDIDRNSNAIGENDFGRVQHSTTSFQWSNGGGHSQINLNAGLHVIDVYSLTAGLTLDSLALVFAGNSVPDYPANSFDIEAIGAAPIKQMASFVDWLYDETRNPHRVLLVELDHADGTVYLGSLPWLSDDNIAYDNFIIGDPYLESTLFQSVDVGDIEFVYPEPLGNILRHHWRGHKVRWYYGDETWRKDEFKLIASATIERCRVIDALSRTYRMELIGDTERYARTFHEGEPLTQSGTVVEAIDWLLAQHEGSGAYQFVNIDFDVLNRPLSFEVTESTRMDGVLELIAASITAEIRISQSGFLEFVRPDRENPAPFDLNDHNVIDNLRMIETIDPVARIIVVYNLGEDSVTVRTGALTGDFDEELTIQTALTNEADARAVGEYYVPIYSKTQNTWEMMPVDIAKVMQVAEVATINHPQTTGTGVISQVRQTPLSRIGRIEVTI